MINVAIITATGQQVEIVAVNGGWTTISVDGETSKVRNGALSGHTAITAPTTAQLVIEKAKASARAKMDINERKNGKVDPLYLPQYTAYTAVRKDGTKIRSIDKGDAIAVMLRGQPLETTYKDAAAATGIALASLKDRFAHLNPGMQRMNLGNMIRRAMKESANA